MSQFDHWPLLIVFAAIVLIAVVAAELGFLFGRRIRHEDGLDKYPLENSASGIVLGLLAFILAFAFGSAASRYADLREIARLDNDAIEDFYLMSDFLPNDSAQDVRSLLSEYHEVRLKAIDSQDMKQLGVAIERSGEIHDELWSIVVDARKADNNSILNQVVASLQEMMDTHEQRVNRALVTRLPSALWWTILALLTLSALLLGLSSGLHGKRSRFAAVVVIACFSAVFVMIVDLDRPFRTLFSVVQSPADNALLKKMKTQ